MKCLRSPAPVSFPAGAPPIHVGRSVELSVRLSLSPALTTAFFSMSPAPLGRRHRRRRRFLLAATGADSGSTRHDDQKGLFSYYDKLDPTSRSFTLAQHTLLRLCAVLGGAVPPFFPSKQTLELMASVMHSLPDWVFLIFMIVSVFFLKHRTEQGI